MLAMNVPALFRGFRLRRARKETSEADIIEISERIVDTVLPEKVLIKATKLPIRGTTIEKYPVDDPWAYVEIVYDEKTANTYYIVREIELNDIEIKIFASVMSYIIYNVGGISPEEDPAEFLTRKANEAIDIFRLHLGKTPTISWGKILYYVTRNTLKYDVITPLMMDPNLEDVSCNGVGIPIYVYHRKYESMPTNIIFNSSEDLDAFVIKLAHMAGKHISVAFPILDASLPGGHRLAATFMREVSQKGSTFTIRKFREDPITIVDMIGFGTLSPEVAAYLWTAIEHKKTILIMGVTGSGKTTLLNSILNLVKPNYKIVTIEDTPEIRLPSKNWVQLVARPSYAAGESRAGEISLYDLVRVSLRYRPDIIVVGEVRGAEAYVLFQSIATGHGGATTIHAESIDAAIKRLTSPPMNIPESYIPLINIALMVERVSIKDSEGRTRAARRVTRIWEVDGDGKPIPMGRWLSNNDQHMIMLDKSIVLSSIAEKTGGDLEHMLDLINERTKIIEWLRIKNMRNYMEIAAAIRRYLDNPAGFVERITAELNAISS
jgi:flagellar protein FlaI